MADKCRMDECQATAFGKSTLCRFHIRKGWEAMVALIAEQRPVKKRLLLWIERETSQDSNNQLFEFVSKKDESKQHSDFVEHQL